MTATLTKSDLAQFTGSETWYRHGLIRKILFTDGAKYVADRAGAYWLIDEIAFAQLCERTVMAEEFQVWKLTVDLENSTGHLICGDGNGNTVYGKGIPFTDFPLPEISLWFENDTIFLPSER